MQVGNNFYNIALEQIPVDEYWNTGSEKECRKHKIHAYHAKFPAFITTKAIEFVKRRGGEVNLIADIFCGCGTVAYETKKNGIDFWGCDINPVATLIAEVKSQKYQDDLLKKYSNEIVNVFSSLIIANEDIENINERFKNQQIRDLLALKRAISIVLIENVSYKKFFLCAFSNILKSTSVWLTKSIKPQVDPDKVPAVVIDAFVRQVDMMIKANNENLISNENQIKIENINFLDKKIENSFADLIVTSPPYVTSYEYADLHQLSTLWLGFVDDYKILRKGTIGSIYHESDYEDNLNQLSPIGLDIVSSLYKVDKSKAKAASKYFVDMQKVTSKAFQLLNNNGYSLFVIGNTEYKKVKIDNAKHLIESMYSAGFRDLEIIQRKISKKILTPYRDSRGKFTSNKNSRQVYSEEFIIIGKKYED